MIPEEWNDLQEDVTVQTMPSFTYCLKEGGNRIEGKIDGREALLQAIWLVLNTERYAYLIYSWNYGVELAEKIGSNMPLACLQVQGAICEALLQDERIVKVDDFTFEPQGEELLVKFSVHSVFGEMESEVKLHV